MTPPGGAAAGLYLLMDRSTFHEFWYRVSELRPRVRSVVRSYRQHYRGRLWQVLVDPGNNKHFRVSEPAFYFASLLDGKRTVDQAWKSSREVLADESPTQGEVIQLLSQLWTNNLLESGLPVDVQAVFERQRRRTQREVKGQLTNFLFLKIPLLDPDRFLDVWERALGWLFGPVGLIGWVLLLVYAGTLLAGRSHELASRALGVLDPENLWLLYVAMAGTKLLHEMGHGLACKRFGRDEQRGAEVHTLGIMFLVLVPMPYIDASSSWAFRSKWRRAFVAAAGMYVELAVAAIAAIVWSQTASGTLVNALAFNIVIIAGVTTLLFNLNPLIRFDGYFILCDLLELPNLQQRSKDMLAYLIKRHAFGVKKIRRVGHDLRERAMLVFYGVASFLYRILLYATIIFAVAEQFFFIGTLMALGGLFGWVVLPLAKSTKYLLTSPDLARVRTRALAVTAAFIAGVVVLIGMVRWPEHGRAEGVVEAVQRATIFAGADGFIGAFPDSGARIDHAGALLFQGRNDELQVELEQLEAQQRLTRLGYHQAVRDDPARAQAMREQLVALEARLNRVRQQIQRLRVEAPFPGVWYGGDYEGRRNAFVAQGTAVGMLVSDGGLIVRATADQFLGPRLEREMVEQAVEIRPKRRPQDELVGQVAAVIPVGRRLLPAASLGHSGGGRLATEADSQPQQGQRSVEPFFEVRIDLPPDQRDAVRLIPGQRVEVRFELPSATLFEQGMRKLRQLLQRRFAV